LTVLFTFLHHTRTSAPSSDALHPSTCQSMQRPHPGSHLLQGLWGGRLPDDWQVIDAEMYAVLAYLRKMATAEDAADRRCLVLSDCKPALQQIEAAYRKGSLEGLREEVASRGYADIAPSLNPSRSCGYRATRGALATPTPTPRRRHTWGPARLRMPPPSSVKQ